jgi:hypothetical protein
MGRRGPAPGSLASGLRGLMSVIEAWGRGAESMRGKSRISKSALVFSLYGFSGSIVFAFIAYFALLNYFPQFTVRNSPWPLFAIKAAARDSYAKVLLTDRIAEWGDGCVPALVRGMHSTDEMERLVSIEQAGRFRSETIVVATIPLLADRSSAIRCWAVTIVGRVPSAHSMWTIASMFISDSSIDVRRICAGVLVKV